MRIQQLLCVETSQVFPSLTDHPLRKQLLSSEHYLYSDTKSPNPHLPGGVDRCLFFDYTTSC